MLSAQASVSLFPTMASNSPQEFVTSVSRRTTNRKFSNTLFFPFFFSCPGFLFYWMWPGNVSVTAFLYVYAFKVYCLPLALISFPSVCTYDVIIHFVYTQRCTGNRCRLQQWRPSTRVPSKLPGSRVPATLLLEPEHRTTDEGRRRLAARHSHVPQ